METNNKHTPEPWKTDYSEDNTVTIIAPWSKKVTTENYSVFADYRGGHICNMKYNSGVPNKETATANAERIVQCVNAMEGIEDPYQFMEDVHELQELKQHTPEPMKFDGTQEELNIMLESEILILNDKSFISKEKVFDLVERWGKEVLKNKNPYKTACESINKDNPVAVAENLRKLFDEISIVSHTYFDEKNLSNIKVAVKRLKEIWHKTENCPCDQCNSLLTKIQ